MSSKVSLEVTGMDCANCANKITHSLEKSGVSGVQVDFLTGEVSFDDAGQEITEKAITSINRLGYGVKPVEESTTESHAHADSYDQTRRRFLTSLVFTIPLVFHMFLPFHLLHNPWFQLAVSIPVMIIGTIQFGRGAYHSLRAGMPDMDVLIFTGSTAAFVYSIAGMIIYGGSPEVSNYMFFETGATIITLVLLGNLIEQRSVRQTTGALRELKQLQPAYAQKITNIQSMRGEEVAVDSLIPGDLVNANTGDRIAADGIIMKGTAVVNESLISGESIPVVKNKGDVVTGGSLIEDGTVIIEVKRRSSESALSQIIDLVKKAQQSKPEIQKLGDRISAIFVPVVISIALLTFIVSYLFFDITAQKALMSSIAVLVISCPCAMGLATPTAVMAGVGRAAKNGILIRGGLTLEKFAQADTVVFDKTGTLTTGRFRIRKIIPQEGFDEQVIRSILYSIEKHSSHPIARSVVRELEGSSSSITMTGVKEDKGIGVNAYDQEGNLYSAGSFMMVKHFYTDHSHNIYLLKNNRLIAEIDIEDEIRPDAANLVRTLRQRGMKIVLLSGDRKEACDAVASALHINVVHSEKTPQEKMQILDTLSATGKVVMVGDGINDAPALAMASVGISVSDATDVAVQSSQVVLLEKYGVGLLAKAHQLSRLTYSTIRQNLFWAFFYNVLAIPVAAAGYLNPMIAALSMAFSDIIVIGNSVRLNFRKIKD